MTAPHTISRYASLITALARRYQDDLMLFTLQLIIGLFPFITGRMAAYA